MNNHTFKPEDINVASWNSEPKSRGNWSLEHTHKGIQVIHLPTGIVIQVESERDQFRNRAVAFDKLEEALQTKYEEEDLEYMDLYTDWIKERLVMKLTRAARKSIIKKIKKGGCGNIQGTYQLKFSHGLPSLSMTWSVDGERCVNMYITLKGSEGEAIDLPVGWWDQWLIQRALKKYCKGGW